MRKFKVMELGLSSARANHHLASELRFRGQWLHRAGFHPGATVSLTNPEAGVLQLRVINAAQLTAKDFTTAIESFARIGL